MITLKVKNKIKDTKENKTLLPNDKIKVTEERFKEMRTNLKNGFDKYFEIIEIKKKK